jgi:hypothetical protein
MADGGVFAVARSIWAHTELKAPDEPFTKLEAWIWLLSEARWKPRRSLERGEFSHSIRFLEKRWKWKPGRVERFLNLLKARGMIRDTSRDRGRDRRRDTPATYSINNYNDYQIAPLPVATPCEAGMNKNRDEVEASKQEAVPFSKEKGASPTRKPSPTRRPKREPKLQVLDGGKTNTKPDPWKEVFDFGKLFLGASSGGQIAKLKKLYIDAPFVAMTKLHEAKTKTKPAAWLAHFLFTAHDPDGRLDGEYMGDVTGEIA